VNHPTLSIVIPVFNEEEVLPTLGERLAAVTAQAGLPYEIILVDDGSRDRSWNEMCALAERDPHVVLVRLSRNFGHQLAITAGVEHARGDAVVIMDADLQDPPEVVLEMLEHWRDGADVVYGRRRVRAGESRFKLATASGFYRLIRRLTTVDIPADTGDFRLMSRAAVDALNRLGERNRFVRGMVAWIGFRQDEVLYDRAARFAGTTKYPLRKMLRFAADAIFSFSYVPLRVATLCGATVSMASFIYAMYAVMARIFNWNVVHGWASVMVAVVFLGGVQLICVGLLGEYVGRIYDEVKKRPLYIAREVRRAGDRQKVSALAAAQIDI